MFKKIFLFLLATGMVGFYFPARAAEIQMGDQKFEGKVTVHQDGSVTTESTAKEVDVEGGGKKRMKLKSRDGKLMVVDEKGEEMALERGGKFKKRSLIKEGGTKTGKTEGTTGAGTTTTTGTATQGTQAGATTTGGTQTKGTTKATPLKIDIKKMTMEGEEKGMVPAGGPLAVVAEVSASDDSGGPFKVTGELRKGSQKQQFTQTVTGVKKGLNSFTWNVPGKAEIGSYALVVEIANTELKVKDRASKSFRVKELASATKTTTPTTGESTTEGSKTGGAKEKTTQKKVVLKIDLKKMTMENEVKGVVPAGKPLVVVAEVSATDDCPKPFKVTGELKKGTQKKQFTEKISSLQAGMNSFTWNFPGKAEVGSYVLVVEITNTELKIKDRASKSFRVK